MSSFFFSYFTSVKQSIRASSWSDLNMRGAQTSGLPILALVWSNQVVSFQPRINAVLFALWMRADLERQIFKWRFSLSDRQTRRAWFSAFDQHLHHRQLENKLVRAFIVSEGICKGLVSRLCLAPEVFCWPLKTCHDALFWNRKQDNMFMFPDAQADRWQDVC